MTPKSLLPIALCNILGCAYAPAVQQTNDVAELYQRTMEEGTQADGLKRMELSFSDRRHVIISARTNPASLIILDIDMKYKTGIYLADGVAGSFDGRPDLVKQLYWSDDFHSAEDVPEKHTRRFQALATEVMSEIERQRAERYSQLTR